MEQEQNTKNAIRAFFTTEYQRLINFVRGYYNERLYGVEAEDIIQDVALNIYTKASVNAPIENLAAYIFQSLRNRIVDIQRKKKNDTSIDSFEDERKMKILLDMDEEIYDEEEDYENEFFQQKLYKAIEQLKPEEQAVIIETEFNGHTFKQLSKKWEIPMGTLLARKHRALGKLYEILQKEKINNF
jgi:RNA polymerase sigma-70 factor (ECF subfamily)